MRFRLTDPSTDLQLLQLRGSYNRVSYFLVLIFSFQFLISCSKTSKEGSVNLVPIAELKLNLPEPSDLCFGPGNQILYCVSDNTAQVYKLTIQGKILQILPFVGNDLEGVCYVNDQYIFVAEERTRKIIKLDLQGNLISETSIPIEIIDENSGLEGIAYNPVNKCFYILNEVNPGLLIITDENLGIIKKITLNFALDYSGICVDAQNQELWILSDVSATVNRCTLDGKMMDAFKIPVNNPEGIALDSENQLLYIVSDQDGMLYKFQLNK